MSYRKLFVVLALGATLMGQPAYAQEETATGATPATTFTVAPDTAATTGITKVEAGDTLKLDLEQLSSQNIKVQLIDKQGTAEVLAETPLLTDSIGLSVTIPLITLSGRYNLAIIGVEKGEQIMIPLEVAGLVDGTETQTLPCYALLILVLVLILAAWGARSHFGKQSIRKPKVEPKASETKSK